MERAQQNQIEENHRQGSPSHSGESTSDAKSSFLVNVAATEAWRAKCSDRLGWRGIRVFMGLTVAHVSDELQALCTSLDSGIEQRCGGIKLCG